MTVRRISTAFLSILLCICLSTGVCAQSVPAKSEYINDAANTLSEDTELQVIALAEDLKAECGVDLAVLTQRSVTGSMKEFSTAVFEHWELGSRGALVVLSIHDQSYYLLMGTVAQQNFTQTDINNLLLDHMEPYFAQENYDAGVLALCKVLSEEFHELYYVEPEVSEEPAEEKKASGFGAVLLGILKFILILAAMLALVAAFVYVRGEFLKVRKIRHQRREEILTGTAPSSYVPERRKAEPEEEPESLPEETYDSSFPSYNFDENFQLDMDRDLTTPEDPETKEFDFYKTYSSTKYDFETFSKRK